MSEFFKFGKFGKEVSFEQFVSKLNSAEVKDNKDLQQLISLFDIDGNGVIDTESINGNKSEARSLFDKLRESAMSNNNIELEENELTSFIQQSGITKGVKSIQKSLSAFFESISTNPVENIETYAANSQEFTPDEIKEIAVTSISDDVKVAQKLFDTQLKRQGNVSDFVDDLKETFDTDSAGFKINQFISEEELCASLLQQAQDGTLTQRKYLEQKLKLAESLLIKDINTTSLGSLSKILGSISGIMTAQDPLNISHYNSMKGAQREQAIKIQLLRDALKNLKPDELNSVLVKAAIASKVSDATKKILEGVVQKYLSNFKIDTLVQESNEQVLVGYKNPSTGKYTPIKEGTLNTNIENDSIPVYETKPIRRESVNIEQINPVHMEGTVADEIQTKGERLKTFEETFRDERGVEYNQHKVMEYTQKNAKVQLLLRMNNKKQEIYNILHSDTSLVDGNNKHGINEQSAKIGETRLDNSLITALINLYGKDAQKIQNVINSLIGNNTIKVLTNEKGEFKSLDYGLSPDIKSNLMVDLSRKLQNRLEANYQKALNGISLEDYINEASEAYRQAYGDTNSRLLAEGYADSQQEGVQIIKSAVQTGGMVVMIAGQAFPVLGQAMTTAGLITSTLGGTAVDALENYTKDGGPTEQDKKDMLTELGVSLALVGSGIKIGQISESVFRNLVLRNCPKLLAFASEVGVDAAISLVADYAITGQIDLDGEGLSQLQAILTGLIRAKGNFKTYMNTHVGHIPSTKQVTYNDKPSFGLNNGAPVKRSEKSDFGLNGNDDGSSNKIPVEQDNTTTVKIPRNTPDTDIDFIEYIDIVSKFEEKISQDVYCKNFIDIYKDIILEPDNINLTNNERIQRLQLFEKFLENAYYNGIQIDDIKNILRSSKNINLTETLNNMSRSINSYTRGKNFRIDYLKNSLCLDNNGNIIYSKENILNKLYPTLKNELNIDKLKKVIDFLETQNLDNCSIEIEGNLLKINTSLSNKNLGLKGIAVRKKTENIINTYDINDNFRLLNSKNEIISGTMILDTMVLYNAKINEINFKDNSNVTCSVVHKGLNKQIEIKEQKIEHYNDDGILSYVEVWEPSKTKKGAYEIYQEFPDGKKIMISTAEKSNNGEFVIIEKTLESSLGTKTNYSSVVSLTNKNGFSSSSRNYQIKDENCNILLERNQSIKYQDENHYTTKTRVKFDKKLNKNKWLEHSFNVEYKNETFSIKDNNGKEFIVKLSEVMDDDPLTKEYYLPILKQLPVEDLIYIKKTGIKLHYSTSLSQSAFANWDKQSIVLGKHIAEEDRLFTFLHELNHLKDSNLLKLTNNSSTFISQDKHFKEIYTEELNALKGNSNTTNQYLLEYFIKDSDSSQGVKEIIAEAGAINNTDISAGLSFRSQTLQQYFPKTLAYLSQKISELQFQYIYSE